MMSMFVCVAGIRLALTCILFKEEQMKTSVGGFASETQLK